MLTHPTRALIGSAVVTLLILASSGLTRAAIAAEPQTGASNTSSACVDVEVNGYRGLSYDCLGQQLAGPQTPNRPNAELPASELATRQAPNQLGLANKAAASNRMGSNFGKSAIPQRPPVPVHTSPLSVQRP